MRQFLTVLRRVCTRPGLYIQSETYAEVVPFVAGYDLAQSGGALIGFREWLVVHLDGGSNLAWSQLVLEAALRDNQQRGSESQLSTSKNLQAISGLLTLFEKFTEHQVRVGARHIFLEYQSWLEKQDWYGPDSPDWFEKS